MPDDDSVLDRRAPPPDLQVDYGIGAAATGEQVADVRTGAGRSHRRPLVLLVHGGFWRPSTDRAHTGPMAAALSRAGWTVASVEYRREPGRPELTLTDIGTALAVLPARIGGHDGRVLLVGHSAGGQLVLWAAAVRAPGGLLGTLALAPVADLALADRERLGDGAVAAFLGDRTALPDADPAQLPVPATAVTVLHGRADQVVPPAVSRSYLRHHPGARLVEVPGAGHFAVIDPLSRAWDRVLGELGRLAEPGPARGRGTPEGQDRSSPADNE